MKFDCIMSFNQSYPTFSFPYLPPLCCQDSISIHPKLTPKDVPGTLLNLALLNLGSSDPQLRSAAYNLLCALVQSFHLKIDGHLLETSSLCIPANSTLVIVAISSRLASSENHLTLEVSLSLFSEKLLISNFSDVSI